MAPLNTAYMPLHRLLEDLLGVEAIALNLKAYPPGVDTLLDTLYLVAMALYWFILGVLGERLHRFARQISVRNSHTRM